MGVPICSRKPQFRTITCPTCDTDVEFPLPVIPQSLPSDELVIVSCFACTFHIELEPTTFDPSLILYNSKSKKPPDFNTFMKEEESEEE